MKKKNFFCCEWMNVNEIDTAEYETMELTIQKKMNNKNRKRRLTTFTNTQMYSTFTKLRKIDKTDNRSSYFSSLNLQHFLYFLTVSAPHPVQLGIFAFSLHICCCCFQIFCCRLFVHSFAVSWFTSKQNSPA